MPDIKITTDPNTIDIEFRDTATDPNVGITRWIMALGYVEWLQLNSLGGICVHLSSGRVFMVTIPSIPIANHLPIDDINGALVYTTITELLEKLKATVLIK